MASVRMLKKDIDYLVGEVIADCYLTLYFHPDKQEKITNIMRQAVDVRNDMFDRTNHPAEKNNPSLVKKHYAHIRVEMMQKVDELFGQLSSICKK